MPRKIEKNKWGEVIFLSEGRWVSQGSWRGGRHLIASVDNPFIKDKTEYLCFAYNWRLGKSYQDDLEFQEKIRAILEGKKKLICLSYYTVRLSRLHPLLLAFLFTSLLLASYLLDSISIFISSPLLSSLHHINVLFCPRFQRWWHSFPYYGDQRGSQEVPRWRAKETTNRRGGEHRGDEHG